MSPQTARPAAGASRAGLDDFRVAAKSRSSLHPIAIRAQAQRRLQRQQLATRLHRLGARVLFELIDELDRAAHGLGDDLDNRLGRNAGLDPVLLAAVGGNRFPARPLRAVGSAR
jgi:hypothetical protein